jgi:lipoate-protein ligase B
MEAYFLGRADYEMTWKLQERLRRRVLGGGPEVVLLVEHPPVLTLGRSALPSDITAAATTLGQSGVAVVRTSRGGKATYHGPGQLVLYPIVRLRQGVVRHVEALAAAAVAVAAQLGVTATFERERVGVFVGARKLAAIGVHVQRRVAIHGMAVNVAAEACAAFRRGWFLPCGELGGQVTCLAEEVGQPVALATVGQSLLEALCGELGAAVPALQPATASLLAESLLVE